MTEFFELCSSPGFFSVIYNEQILTEGSRDVPTRDKLP